MTKKKYKIFSDISELLFYSIEQNNEELARKMITFLTKAFIEYRENKELEKIIYPDEYYDTIFEANELVCLKQKRTISSLNGGVFLNLYVDNYQKTIISDKTYNALWLCVRQVLSYNRNDILMSYWKNAHQHFEFYLENIIPNYDNIDDKHIITNKEEIENKNNERNKYLEFHNVIGGLLVFLNKYDLLNNILNYTNQTPPVYHLIPSNLSEIINRLIKVKEDYKNPFHFEQTYSFPNVDGVNSGGIIRFWTRKYFAILFIRQYKLYDYYYGDNIFDLPTIPNSLSEMKEWENELDYFKGLVSETLQNEKLLLALGFNDLSNKSWYKEQNKQHPIELIENIISNVKENYEQKKITQELSKEKEAVFYEKTKAIIVKSISKYSVIDNENNLDNITQYPLKGTCQLLEKTDFADDQDISCLNSDTITAQSLSANLGLNITRTFIYFIKYRYLFEPKNIFEAIGKMNFDSANHIIISFGVHLEYYIDVLKIEGLIAQNGEIYFKGLKIVNINTYINPNLIGSLIVIEKNNLPKLCYNKLPKKEDEKYNPKLLEEKYHLYAILIDLNKNTVIREDLNSSNIEDLTKKVFACILINWEIHWRKTTEIYQFRVFDQFNNSGKPNSFSDINPIINKE